MRFNQKVSRLIISFVNWFVYESIRAILGKLFILEKRIDIYKIKFDSIGCQARLGKVCFCTLSNILMSKHLEQCA